MSQAPPFQLNHAMLGRVAEIAEPVATWNAASPATLLPQTRRGNGRIGFLLDAIFDALKQAIDASRPDLGNEVAPVETPVEAPVIGRSRTPERILAVLAAHPTCTLAEVAASVGKSLRAVERAVARLQQQGRLRFVGASKGGRREVPE